MKLTLKQKLLSGLAILFIVLIITNPSAQSFKEYSGYSTYEAYIETTIFLFVAYIGGVVISI